MFFKKDSIYNSFGGYGGTMVKGYDVHHRIFLTFQESCQVTKKTITFTRLEKCNECNGYGTNNDLYVDICSCCEGSGFVRQFRCFGNHNVVMPCSICGGLGKQILNKCLICSGKGATDRIVDFDINVPAGIHDGQTLNIAEEGNCAIGDPNGKSGNLLVFVEVAPHPYLIRDEYNLHYELPISSKQAEVGDSVKIPTVEGVIDFSIPPNTKNGAMFTLRGKGVKRLRQRGSGNLIVKIVIKSQHDIDAVQHIVLNGIDSFNEKRKISLRQHFNKLSLKQ